MTNRIAGALVGLAGMFSASQATANDTIAALAVGGLELLSTEEIAMVSEDLHISLGEVRARYVFRNLTDRDIEATVAFPLPPIDMGLAHGMSLAGLESESHDFVGFQLWVEGEPAKPQLLVQATVDGRDVKPVLDRHSIPYSSYHPDYRARWSELSQQAAAVLAEEGVAETFDDGRSPRPLWLFEAAYHWEQRFPAGATVTVEHVYAPIVSSAFARYHEGQTGEDLKFLRDASPTGGSYCVDAASEAAIRSRLKEMPKDEEGYGIVWVWYADYVLTTANGWAGPIGRFRLTVDVNDPGNIVASCEKGLQKTGPTSFVVEREDYEPTEELSIIILAFPGTPADHFPPLP